MDWKLEVVVLPVTDVDRSKAFYERWGFVCDSEHDGGPDFRVVQLTPPGSSCSITIGVGVSPPAPPGTYHGLHLVVEDIEAAHADLQAKGIESSGPFHFGAEGRTEGVLPSRESYGTFMEVLDPDGNGWLVQEVHRS